MTKHTDVDADKDAAKFSVNIAELDKKTDAQIAADLDRLNREERELDLELKREQVATLKAKRTAQLERARSAQTAIIQYMAQREAQQRACNHLKGGTGAEAFIRGQGDSPYYAVIKHKKPNGKWMVLCQRCNREWHEGSPKTGELETPGFQEAIRFNTNNSTSSSTTFLFERTA